MPDQQGHGKAPWLHEIAKMFYKIIGQIDQPLATRCLITISNGGSQPFKCLVALELQRCNGAGVGFNPLRKVYRANVHRGPKKHPLHQGLKWM